MRARFIGPGDGPGEVKEIDILIPTVKAIADIHAGPDRGRRVFLQYILTIRQDEEGLPIYLCESAVIEGVTIGDPRGKRRNGT